jgi:hypothetical protein
MTQIKYLTTKEKQDYVSKCGEYWNDEKKCEYVLNQNVLDDQWLEFWTNNCKISQPDYCVKDTSLNS